MIASSARSFMYTYSSPYHKSAKLLVTVEVVVVVVVEVASFVLANYTMQPEQ